MIEYQITLDAYGQRLDKWLSSIVAELSRSQLQRLIGEGAVQIDGAVVDNPSLKLGAHHNAVELIIPEPVEMDLSPVAMTLDLLFEDEHLIVINKPAGLIVHPAASTREPTLVHGLLAHCGESLSGIGGVQRPGIVHRLDKDTSGAIIVAKSDTAHQHLSAQLKERSLSRVYHAICYGVPKPRSGVVDAPIGRATKDRKKMAVVEAEKGKAARTHYRVIASNEAANVSLIECKLESGRTHQIRVHLTHLGHPLIGDASYGRARKLKDNVLQGEITAIAHGQLLHAAQIGFIHPITQKTLQFDAVAPYEFLMLKRTLGLAGA